MQHSIRRSSLWYAFACVDKRTAYVIHRYLFLFDKNQVNRNTVHLEYASTQICACRRGVRTHACRVETHLDAWVSRTEICDKRGTGVEMSLDAARTSAYATPAPVYLSEQYCESRPNTVHLEYGGYEKLCLQAWR